MRRNEAGLHLGIAALRSKRSTPGGRAHLNAMEQEGSMSAWAAGSWKQLPLASLPFAAIDFESAGAAPGETDQPVQVGIVRAENLFAPPQCWGSYIACEHPVRWSASRIHGITAGMLADAPRFSSLWPQLRSMLRGCVVVGHNPATEMRFLRAFPGHGFAPWLDTLSLCRQALPGLQEHSLGAVCEAMGLTPDINALVPGRRWHDALYDAAASLCLLRALVRGLRMEEASLTGLSFALQHRAG